MIFTYDNFGNIKNDTKQSVLMNAPIQGSLPNLINSVVSPSQISGGQSKNYRTGVSGWNISNNGNAEFNNGYFRGSITGASGTFSGSLSASSGVIGGFTITPQMLYGGIIQTSATVGAVGTNGVLMDSNGLRGYSATLGQVFNLTTDGTPPVFSNGIVQTSNMYSTAIAGGTIIGAVITGGILRTAFDGRRIEITSSGIQAINGALGITYGDNSKKYGDATRFYGSGVLVYFNNNDFKIPFYVNQEQTVGDIHMYNRSADPSGKAEIGDVAIVNGKLKVCTSNGTPGTWTVAGTQT
jgi:hypothetical protein